MATSPIGANVAQFDVLGWVENARYALPYWPPVCMGTGVQVDHVLAAFHTTTLRLGLLAWPKRVAISALATLDAARIPGVELYHL